MAALLAGAAGGVQAQLQPAEPAAVPPSSSPAVPPAAVPTPGQRVVHAFFEVCVRGQAQATAAVDWALNHGFDPLDPEGRDGTDGYKLLKGRPGLVFGTPDPELRMLMAVTQDRRCTVWAERVGGMSTQDAFVQEADALAAQGAQVRREIDRTLQRAGAWRRQLEYRVRLGTGTQEFIVGAVTTMTETPAAQALHMAPMVAEPAAPGPGEPAGPTSR